MQAVIVDDEQEARDVLRTMLCRHAPEVAILAEVASVAQAMEVLRTHKPDLLFLDVQMPGGDGFELLKRLGAWDFDVIFTTGSSKHAIQAIRFSALDYLVKPVLGDELLAAIDRHIAKRGSAPDVQAHLLHNIAQPDERTMKLTLTSGDRSYFIPPSEVVWCEADVNYTNLYLKDERRFVSARTLKDYEDMLSPLGFLRTHRSYLVNRAHIDHLDKNGYVVLRNGQRVEVASRRREEVAKALSA
ncbi:MAG: response regulator transcription factor [Bacteroidetes bacterium]|nr:response regulator transcription factor [Bacteroidota bacterium]MBS1940626.1 response regulator transcription factor [Bacteroidota bacterium]